MAQTATLTPRTSVSVARARNSLEVLDIWGNDDVYVLGSADHPPSINGKTADQHELDVCLRESAKELIEGRFGQCGRAVPTNCISLWLSAIPSARLVLIGRRASSRRRWTRIASAAAAGLLEVLLGRWIEAMKRR
jgi:hypothetical protein